MGGNLQAIWNKVCEINDKLDLLPSLIEISGNQVNVYTLDELGDNLGLIKAGEFRSGNNRIPGDGFGGMRIRYPPMYYPDTSTESSDAYNLVGVDADTMQVGIRSSDGVLIAGGGNLSLASAGLQLVQGTGTFNAIRWMTALDTGDLYGRLICYEQGVDPNNYGLVEIGAYNEPGASTSEGVAGRIILKTFGRDAADAIARNSYVQLAAGAVNIVSGRGANTSSLTLNSTIGLTWDGVTGNAAVFNEAGNDLDFRVESADNANMLFVDAGNNRVGIGTATPTAVLDVNSDILRLRTAKTPASQTAAGNAGDICWDASFIYICTATNYWERAAIAAW